MYFVNMLNDEVISRRRGCPLEITVNESPAVASCIFKDGKLQINNGNSKEDLFAIKEGYKDEDEYNPTGRRLGKSELPIFYRDIKDTEENPLITVLCSVIRVYENIPTGIKFLYINDKQILACLLYGVADFDGVAMQRGIVENISTENKKSKALTGFDLRYLVDLRDEETHYEYVSDTVVQVEFLYRSSTQGSSFASRKAKKDTVVFDTTGIEKAKEKKRLAEERIAEMERRKAEEAEKKKAEAEERYKNSSFAQEIERTLQEERDKKAKRTEKKSTGKQKEVIGKVTDDPTVQNASAAAFLRIFQSKK